MNTLAKHVVKGTTPGPHLLVTGGVHGDEFEPMAAIRQLIKVLKPEELKGQVTLAPVVNESAFMLKQRVAEDGLDLARSCPGRSDGSVTEQIAFLLSKLIESADYYIDLHTGGTRMRLMPMAGYMLHPKRRVLEVQRDMARAFNLPIVWGTTPSLEGRSISIARDAEIPAIYCEYLGGGGCSAQGVQDYYHGCLNVMGCLRMIERPVTQSQVKYFVEDLRPNSGHLQSCHPSPVAGFFEPAVELGQHVELGTLLGCVTDLLGAKTVKVSAEHSGIVIGITTFCSVKQGEGLIVLLEIEETIKTRDSYVKGC